MQNQNDVGTILYIERDQEIIFPFTKIGEKFRGGIFWCLPNQGITSDPFVLQNGEYRTLEGSGEKHLKGPWGILQSSVIWEFGEKMIRTIATLVSERTPTHIRPGLHPYFQVGESFDITIGNTHITKEDIANESVIYLDAPGKEAILKTSNKTITISYSIETGVEYTPFFCIWTDNKERYICIEPVAGKEKDDRGAIVPLTLSEEDTFIFTATISY